MWFLCTIRAFILKTRQNPSTYRQQPPHDGGKERDEKIESRREEKKKRGKEREIGNVHQSNKL